MTETGSGVVYDGVPLDGVDVRIADDGEIHVGGAMLLRAYRRADADVDPLTSGWLATGDLGGWLPDGRLRVDGRRSDLIISGGENVWPEPVERAIRRDPRVADVAVAGTPDPEWGQVVTAYVVPAGDQVPTLDELRRAVGEVLPAYCAPRLVQAGRVDPDHAARQATAIVAATEQPHGDRAHQPLPARGRSGITSASGRAARCSGVSPPHTPSRSPVCRAWARQAARISQRTADADGLAVRGRVEPQRRVVARAQRLGLALCPRPGERHHDTAHALMMNKGCHGDPANYPFGAFGPFADRVSRRLTSRRSIWVGTVSNPRLCTPSSAMRLSTPRFGVAANERRRSEQRCGGAQTTLPRTPAPPSMT